MSDPAHILDRPCAKNDLSGTHRIATYRDAAGNLRLYCVRCQPR